MPIRAAIAAAFIGIAASALAAPENANWPNYQEGDFVIADYKFASGESLPQLKLHYRTLGTAQRNAAGEIVNGVLLLQGNTGTGANWLRPSLADELFKDGQPLDARHYFIIMPDALGRGGSSKPSDGLKGNFPHDKNPAHYIYSAAARSFMPESAARIQEAAPPREAADKLYDEHVARIAKLWAIESIEDYSPEPDLPKIKAKVLLINTVEDAADPPELSTVERAMKAIPDGRYVLIPYSDKTHEHFTHYYAAVWRPYLISFMGTLDPTAAAGATR